ncbi:MAG: NAD(P)-dependent oxidoreductase [Bacteroidetes bacterium]|nr:NAD(P)-dependent oxidoreductase [Bacteroidota bacterium]
MQRIGWIGLGNMGIPMAKNLLKAGFELTVYNRTAAKAASLTDMGARLADSPSALWKNADTVIIMVSDDKAALQVLEGPHGLLHGAGAGKTVINMSTVSPATGRHMAGDLAAKGAEYLDAPVSGSVKPAELAQLIVLAGGKREVFEAAKPIFEKLGKISFYMGGQGAGNSAKLAINMLVAFNMQGLAETIHFARENGIAPAEMMAIINESAVGNGFSKLKTPNLVNDEHPAAFALQHMAKDLRLAKEEGMNGPAGLAVEESYRKAAAAGLGELDLSAILKFLEQKGN